MRKKTVFSLIIVFIVYLFFELICFAAEAYLARYKDMKYSPHIDKLAEAILNDKQLVNEVVSGTVEPRRQFDADLGWKFTPNYRTPWEIMTNGIRDEKSYTFEKPAGVVRMLAFGDSFTYCDEVANTNTWEKYLNDSGSIQVLNFGVPGYGLDQAYLRYLKEARQYKTDYVLIGYMVENINRHVNTFRYFYSPVVWYYSKPRFYLENGKLKLLENYFKTPEEIRKLVDNPKKVIAELGKKDFFYQTRFYSRGFFDFLPSVRLYKVLSAVYREEVTGMLRNDVYNTQSEAYQVTEKIFDSFVADVKKTGAVPIILVFPDRDDLLRQRAGKPKRYEALLNHFKERNYRFFDVMDAFDKNCPNCDLKILINNHYSPLGNMIVAKGFVENFVKDAQVKH